VIFVCTLSVSNNRFDHSNQPPYDESQNGSEFTLSTDEQVISAVDTLIVFGLLRVWFCSFEDFPRYIIVTSTYCTRQKLWEARCQLSNWYMPFCHLLTLDLATSSPDATSQDTSLSRPRIVPYKDCEKVDLSCQISACPFSSFTYFRVGNIQSRHNNPIQLGHDISAQLLYV